MAHGDDWREDWEPPEVEGTVPHEAWEPEPREVVAMLLGPDGEPLSMLLDRPVVPFGFGLGPRTPEWWVRS